MFWEAWIGVVEVFVRSGLGDFVLERVRFNGNNSCAFFGANSISFCNGDVRFVSKDVLNQYTFDNSRIQ